MEVTDNDLRTLLFCSLRYSMGEANIYASRLVQGITTKHINVLTHEDRIQLADEIENATFLGSKDDTNEWKQFAEFLRKEVK